MEAILIIALAISLSMDAFSLSLAYGTLGIDKKQRYLLGLIVGVFHFFMPLIGLLLGNIIFSIIRINSHIMVTIVLIIIGLEMMYESLKKEEQVSKMKTLELFFFAFAVSIDSFSLGITLNTITDNYIFASTAFALSSAFFTIVGLKLGNKIKTIFGKISPLFGGITLIIIGILYII